jgi:hypothetical protein
MEQLLRAIIRFELGRDRIKLVPQNEFTEHELMRLEKIYQFEPKMSESIEDLMISLSEMSQYMSDLYIMKDYGTLVWVDELRIKRGHDF